jgi:hypothetical protein
VTRLLLLCLEFLAISVPLTWVWLEWVRSAYVPLVFASAAPLRELLDIAHAGRGPAVPRFLGYIPFLALMLITPLLSRQRRLLGTLIGMALIFVSHVGLALVVDYAYATNPRNSRAVAAMFPALLAVDALPFLIWAVIASDFVRSLFSRRSDPAP